MNVFNSLVYLFYSATSRALYSLKLIDKNHFLFQKKRQYLITCIPDTKLIAEVASVAHTFSHPYKNDKDIESMKFFLSSLLEECKSRKINNKITRWAFSVINNKYIQIPKKDNKKWLPELKNLAIAEKIFKERKTNRYISDEKLDKKLVYRLIESAIEAPSSCNKQPWRFIIIDEKDKIEKISKLKGQKFVSTSPFVLCVCFDINAYMGHDSKMTPYLDCGAAIMNLCNAACAANVAVCWCNFTIANSGKKKHDLVRKILTIPKHLIPVSFVTLGVPSKDKIKKPLREDTDYYLPFEKK